MIKSKRFLFLSIIVLFLFGLSSPIAALSDFYWEAPSSFTGGNARFPVSAFRGDLSVLAWQESSPIDDGSLLVRVSMAVKRGSGPWVQHRSVAGPYTYSGSEPSILSLVIDTQDRIVLATAASSSKTEILVSKDAGLTFTTSSVNGGSESALAPRLYVASDGGYLLFVTRGTEQSLSIFVSKSKDALSWSPFQAFVTEPTLRLNFLPTHASLGAKDIVVFQSLSGEVRPSFQLFAKTSSDGGLSWSPARQITNFRDLFVAVRPESENFDNQRPYLFKVSSSLFLTWERRAGTGSPQIYIAELAENGSMLGEADRVTSVGAYCNDPIGFDYKGEATIIWFDNRRGKNRAYLAQKNGIIWEESDLSGSGFDVSFARPVSGTDGLSVFWQSPQAGTDRLYLLQPDRSIAKPTLSALNFTSGKRVRGELARLSWQAPNDTSGIAGYAYSWSMDSEVEPPQKLMMYPSSTRAEERATEDGSWYFSLIAQDYAGNWSKPVQLEYLRDTTPPPAASIIAPILDEQGYLASNTFTINWNAPPASDIDSYAWELEYLAPLDSYVRLSSIDFEDSLRKEFVPKTPTPRSLGKSTSASFINRDNGVWRFSVSAVDQVGNIGPASEYYFRINKYIPYTYITFADAQKDEQGVLSLKLIGRGFAENGRVSSVFLDRDGKAPYDREFSLERGEYRVISDRELDGLRVEDLEEGLYRIGLIHPERGIYLTAPLVNVDEMGTVKFGDYSRSWKPSWRSAEQRRFVIDTVLLVLAAVALLGGLGLLVSIRGIGDVLSESAAIRVEVAALITGDIMPSEKKKRAASVRKRGVGLRIKLAFFTIVLVAMVVAIVAAPLSILMTGTQEATLLRGLKDRSRVLLESLASGARAYLPSKNVLELGFLPAQTVAVPEASYATITGFGSEATVFNDHIWATNDPDITGKIDTAEYQAGISRLEDSLSLRLSTIAEDLDKRARAEVGDISESIASLTQEGLKLALRTDAESIRRRDDIQVTTRTLEGRLTERLTVLASEVGSGPSSQWINYQELISASYSLNRSCTAKVRKTSISEAWCASRYRLIP
ncbi:hypothetical protein MASR2M78_04820 [Treponema sp.]